MNRPSSFDARLTAWLEEGPTTGPDDLLADVHARARSVRQRPGWWLALKGDTMTTTWRARPAPFSGRLAFILLTALLLLVIAAATVLVGSRPTAFSDGPATDGAMAVAPVIPTGDEALFAFTTYSSSDTAATSSSSAPMAPRAARSPPTHSTTGRQHGHRMGAASRSTPATRTASSCASHRAMASPSSLTRPAAGTRPRSRRPGQPDGRFILYVARSGPERRCLRRVVHGRLSSSRQTGALRVAASSRSRTPNTRVNRPGMAIGSSSGPALRSETISRSRVVCGSPR